VGGAHPKNKGIELVTCELVACACERVACSLGKGAIACNDTGNV